MDKIRDILENLCRIEKDWYYFITDSSKYGQCENEEAKEEFKKLLEELKKAIKEEIDIEEIRALLKEKISNEHFVEILLNRVIEITEDYFAFSALRNIEKKDSELLENFIKELFQNYFIRFDFNFSEKYRVFGFENEQELNDILDLLEYLLDLYISNRLSSDCIYEDLKDETGISDKMCGLFLSYFEKNYHELSMNYMIRRLSSFGVKNIEGSEE